MKKNLQVWDLWSQGKGLEFIDILLTESSSAQVEELLRCIQIGLLCVQEDAADRPTMSSVVVMLGSDELKDLPQPTEPAFSVGKLVFGSSRSRSATTPSIFSANDVTISDISPR